MSTMLLTPPSSTALWGMTFGRRWLEGFLLVVEAESSLVLSSAAGWSLPVSGIVGLELRFGSFGDAIISVAIVLQFVDVVKILQVPFPVRLYMMMMYAMTPGMVALNYSLLLLRRVLEYYLARYYT